MCIFILPIFPFRLSRRQGTRVVIVIVVVGGCAQLRRRRAREECHSAAFSVELEHGAILRLRSETRGGVPPSVFSYGEHVLHFLASFPLGALNLATPIVPNDHEQDGKRHAAYNAAHNWSNGHGWSAIARSRQSRLWRTARIDGESDYLRGLYGRRRQRWLLLRGHGQLS
jgi:hypothetical protein